MTEETQAAITRRLVAEEDRLKFLPRHFGRLYLRLERAIFSCARTLSSDYSGGLWSFYDLSNSGAYMAPETGEEGRRFKVVIEGNYFEGELTADAFGIVACLFAYSHVSMSAASDNVAEHYHALLAYAREHEEADLILAAID